jgi:hypothetical protein
MKTSFPARSLSLLVTTCLASGGLVACGSGEAPAPKPVSPATSDGLSAGSAAGAHTFRWDFSKERTWTYTYSQRMKMHVDVGDAGGAGDADDADESMKHEEEVTGVGFVDIVSKADGSANLVLRDVALQVGGEPQEVPPVPPLVTPGVKEDGSVTGGGDSASAFLTLLFPLPRRPLAIGESDEVPFSVPFNTAGTTLSLRGNAKVTFTGLVAVGDRTCAAVAVVVEASRLDVPPEVRGIHEGSVKGTANYCFDLAERAFVKGTYAYAMSTKNDMGDAGVQSMAMDTQITLERKKP